MQRIQNLGGRGGEKKKGGGGQMEIFFDKRKLESAEPTYTIS